MDSKEDTQEREKTFIIAGINGEIGTEFAKRCQGLGGVYGISRKPNKIEYITYDHIQCDLLNQDNVKEMFESLNISGDLTYVHLPGKFQFQDENHPIVDYVGDGIDDETFTTNVETFRVVSPYLIKYLIRNSEANMKLVGIGSTSDLYNIPFFDSFTQSKNELKKEFRKVYGTPEVFERVSSLFINVSTVDGEQLNGERPYIKKQFLLTPQNILDNSLEYILDNRSNSLEISILHPNPEFSREDFLDHKVIKQRWYKDMYGLRGQPRTNGFNISNYFSDLKKLINVKGIKNNLMKKSLVGVMAVCVGFAAVIGTKYHTDFYVGRTKEELSKKASMMFYEPVGNGGALMAMHGIVSPGRQKMLNKVKDVYQDFINSSSD